MSQYVAGVIKSFIAGTDMRLNQYYFMASTGTTATNNNKVSPSGANGKTVGILLNTPNTGENATVIITGTAKLKVNEAVANGKYLTPTSTGLGEIVDAAGEHVGAQAIETATAQNDVIEVIVRGFTAHASDA